MRRPVILVDNGHGRDTKGKCSPDAAKGLIHSPHYFKEFSWARKCAQVIVSVLTAQGYTAFLLVKEEEDISLQERVARANAYCRTYGKENVVLISVHVNAAGNGSQWMNARGWSAFTTKGVTESDRLAAKLIDAADEVFKAPLKVRKYSAADKYSQDFEENFYILRNTACPAVLTENFFQDNRADVEYLKSARGLGDCIECHVRGLEYYIEERYGKA